MSVLIKGMTMPKTCYDCKLMYDAMKCIVTGTAFNGFNGSYFDFEEGQLLDCPLVELPAKHGRLIDEDNVIDAIHERLHVLQTHSDFRKKHGDIDLLGVMPYIAKIQSVIEAEGEG